MFQLLSQVKEKNPLVLHYTNEVTINDCANITLALGASPLMSYSYEEAEELISICSAVVINIGTMNSAHVDLFVKAGKLANEYKKPVILDPVGAFATKERAILTKKLIESVQFDVIKGNMAEIQCIAGLEAEGKGVDAGEQQMDVAHVKALATSLKCTIAATGKSDIITDGERVVHIHNGTPKLKSITGTGCMTASLIGSYVGTSGDAFHSAAMGVLTMSLCGELADVSLPPIGQFKVELMDQVYLLDEERLQQCGKVEFS